MRKKIIPLILEPAVDSPDEEPISSDSKIGSEAVDIIE